MFLYQIVHAQTYFLTNRQETPITLLLQITFIVIMFIFQIYDLDFSLCTFFVTFFDLAFNRIISK